MSHRQLGRSMDCREFAEWQAVHIVEAEMDVEARRRAQLEADALAGLKARQDAKRRR